MITLMIVNTIKEAPTYPTVLYKKFMIALNGNNMAIANALKLYFFVSSVENRAESHKF